MAVDLSGTDTVAYVRVSTERQAGESVTSMADQEAAIRALAAKMGRTVGHWFRDEASGATAEQRPQFSAMLAACAGSPRKPQRPGAVLVLNDSRFGRFDDPEDAAFWRVTLRRSGWFVRFAEGDDTEDKTGRTLMRAIHATAATTHRDTIRANARRGMRGTASQGYWTARVPYGYRRKVVYPPGRERVLEAGVGKATDEKVQLVPHEAEAAIIRELFHRYAGGTHSLDTLTEWLLTVAPGRRWTRPAVRWMLRNPVYVGDVVAGRLHSQKEDRRAYGPRPASDHYGKAGAHPALVSRTVYAAAQARLVENAKRRRGVRSPWIVSGLVRCRCGAVFASGGGGGRDGRLASYRCVTRGRHPSARCPYPGTVLKPLLESAVVDTIAAWLASKRARTLLVKALDASLAADVAPAETVAALERRDAMLTAKRDRLTAAIADGTLTSGEAAPVLAEVRAALAAVAGERDALARAADWAVQRAAERDALIADLHDFPAVARRYAGPELRELLRPWIARAVFDTATRVLTLEIRHVPALGRVEDTMADLVGSASATERNRDRGAGTTVRRVVVGRRRA